MSDRLNKGNKALDYQRCRVCGLRFEPIYPQHKLCLACYHDFGDREKGWHDYWDWRVFGLAPHLNFQGWSNEFEREYYRLVWRDEIE